MLSAKLLLAGMLLVATPPQVTLTAPSTRRRSSALELQRDGEERRQAGRSDITAQIVDPIGGVHPVDFGNTTKHHNGPFKGTFHDFVIWPADSRGIPLTFRLTVKVGNDEEGDQLPRTPPR